MSFYMPQQVLCSALEKIIHQALVLNQNDNDALTSLNEKSLTVFLSELGFPLCFSVVNQKCFVTGIENDNDCSINTSVKTLWQLKQHQQLTELIKQEKLDLQGDIKVAQQFAALFENIDIDWPSELAKHIGDVPTYQLSQAFNSLKGKADFARQQIQADASEWLVHEQKLIVSHTELQQFYQSVAETSDKTQALAVKLQALIDKTATKLAIK